MAPRFKTYMNYISSAWEHKVIKYRAQNAVGDMGYADLGTLMKEREKTFFTFTKGYLYSCSIIIFVRSTHLLISYNACYTMEHL